MALFELVLIMLLGAAVLTTFSQRIGLPSPVLLALSGAALALLPGEAVSAQLDPDRCPSGGVKGKTRPV